MPLFHMPSLTVSHPLPRTRRLIPLTRSAAALVLAAVALPAAAQPIPCDQGIVRLQDKTGTVQICSALAAQVPALSQQLAAAVKLMGNQQQQLAELKRLVSGINGSSAALDAARQGQLLRNLSSEMGQAQQRGANVAQRTVAQFTDQFEQVRDQLNLTLARPGAAPLTQQALQGRLGDSIAQLELRSAHRQLDQIGEQLKAIQADVGAVRSGVDKANDKLDVVVAAVNPDNPSDRCASLECAFHGNAKVATVERLVKNGARLPPIPQMAGMFVQAAVNRPPAEREALLALLLRAGLSPQVRLQLQAADGASIREPARRLAEAVVNRIGPDSGYAAAATGAGDWAVMASCLSFGNQGVNLSELAVLLGDAELLHQAQGLGFDRPRPELRCRSLQPNGRAVTLVIDAAGKASLKGS